MEKLTQVIGAMRLCHLFSFLQMHGFLTGGSIKKGLKAPMAGFLEAFRWVFTWEISGARGGLSKHTTKLNTKNCTMKLKTTFTIIFSLLTVLVTLGQTIDETFCFAEKQFLAGNYQLALLEYQRVVFFDNDKKYNNIYQKIGESFYAVNNFESAVKNFDIAAKITKNDSLTAEMYFKKALCYFKQDNYFFALNELLGLKVPTSLYFQRKYN